MSKFEIIKKSAGIVEAKGFRAIGVHCDVRNKGDNRLDLAMIVSETPCTPAAVFTTNVNPSSTVVISREVARCGYARGIIANSGNANAWTGSAGWKDARAMQRAAALSVGAKPDEFFVCSTGRIGQRLPIKKIISGIERASHCLSTSATSGRKASKAILTTDTRPKVCAVRVSAPGGAITISGIAKGAGMIQPDMATMLAFIVTDAAISKSLLQKILTRAVDVSFNAITIDGDRSTNDSVIALANAASGIKIKPGDKKLIEAFSSGFQYVCSQLADKIVSDGERITKVVEILISGAKSRSDADKVARAIGNSLLVKTSWYGNDPNWGRIMDAAGYAGVLFTENNISLHYRSYPANSGNKPIPVFSNGRVYDKNKPRWRAVVKNRRFSILFNLNEGDDSFRLLATDLSEDYVNFNKSE